MTLNIFITYSQTDSKPEAEFLDDYLKENISNSSIFFDKQIERGAEWRKKIKTKLENSDVVVVILTNSSIKSTEVAKEVKLAKKLHKTIIPCKDKLLRKNWSQIPWALGKLNGIDFETKEELGKNLVFGIEPIEESKTRKEKEQYDSYLDDHYGTIEIEGQIFTSSEIFKLDKIAYDEGFNNWRNEMLIAKDFEISDITNMKKQKDLNLNDEQYAIYEAVFRGREYVKSENILPNVAITLTDFIKDNITIDWMHRESIRAKIRSGIKNVLFAFGFNPVSFDKLVPIIMFQAENKINLKKNEDEKIGN